MWAACRPLARLTSALAYRLVGAVGTAPLRLLGARDWEPPTAASDWDQILEHGRDWFGGFDELAVYSPRQAERSGFGLMLLSRGRAVGFCKVRPPGRWYDVEVRALAALRVARTFTTPGMEGSAVIGRWAVVGYSPVGLPRHGPRLARPPEAIAEELSQLLGSTLVSDSLVPDHWRPIHGDMGPWNLRQVRGRTPVLYDWEHAAYGPPGADVAFHAAACAAMRIGGGVKRKGFGEEVVSYWVEEIERRFGAGRSDRLLADQMTAYLLEHR